MRIGIPGTGSMAAATAAARIGAAGHGGHGGLAGAAGYGGAVLMAVSADSAPGLARELAPVPAGRTVLDCTVPMAAGPDGPSPATAGGTDSVAARISPAAPDAGGARVFGICHERVWTLPRPAFEGAPLAVPFCAGSPAAAVSAAEPITSVGCGGLSRAALPEPAAVFAAGVWWSGGAARHALPSPALAPGAVGDEP
ncbi:NADP oxidoreductase [Streptomyces sp. NPDC001502]|uniref:NADP oxidoreductase n=1 Tax=Streptomyces sp. NPDC001502 TaxID=3364578 RepID=UPI003693CD05